jgi:hypothetical protein
MGSSVRFRAQLYNGFRRALFDRRYEGLGELMGTPITQAYDYTVLFIAQGANTIIRFLVGDEAGFAAADFAVRQPHLFPVSEGHYWKVVISSVHPGHVAVDSDLDGVDKGLFVFGFPGWPIIGTPTPAVHKPGDPMSMRGWFQLLANYNPEEVEVFAAESSSSEEEEEEELVTTPFAPKVASRRYTPAKRGRDFGDDMED